ncbi:hypothetical protein [Chryseobacterium sp.]|uniref:HD domain-containing protein n=1 Tax=Chryseobacterium sp. TaxID=1871047 RepID=UPI002897E57A|nr:hypothetical protein [Chryseobacterium sp.]
MLLKTLFFENSSLYSSDLQLIEKFWDEIVRQYSKKSRHYHNLEHLENMFNELEMVKNQIVAFDLMAFSVFYHDIIYKASSKVNEEKSAELAVSKLNSFHLSKEQLAIIEQQILATKKHQKSGDNDVNLLIDADLSILGAERNIYKRYTENIRKEYSVYPDLLYKPGRKKALMHFLEFESIFKTEHFRNKYENQARENIEWEIGIL